MRVLAAAAAFMLAVTMPARADVTFCNKTPSTNLSFAVAADVTDPYPTWEVAGWFNIDAGTCKTTFTGDYTGRKVYWFAYADGNRDVVWQPTGNPDYYTICIPNDTSAFDRKGSATDLQAPCRNSLQGAKFFCMAISNKDFTYSFWLASDPSMPTDVRKKISETPTGGACG